MSAPAVSADQVAKQLAKAAEHLDVVPVEFRPLAGAALDAIDPEKVARIGTLGLARAWGWWAAFGADAPIPREGATRDQALARLTAAGDRLQELEEAEREALEHAKDVALDVGKKVLMFVVPLLLAAL